MGQGRLIWMDKQMPRMGGIEATRKIRAEECSEDRGRVAIIAVSASALRHEWGDILAAGCDDFLPKPFHENEMFAKMATQLDLGYLYESETEEQPDAAQGPLAGPFADLAGEWIAAVKVAIAGGDIQQAGGLADQISEHVASTCSTSSRLALGTVPSNSRGPGS